MSVKAKANRGPSAGPQNRASLVAAARLEFAEYGIDAPLSAVAKRAGVGQGSLYRHFPDRISLAVAVFEENMADIEALAAREDTDLRVLADAVTHHTDGAAPFINMIARERSDERVTQFEARLRAVIERVLARGPVPPTPGAVEDVLLAMSMVSVTVARTPVGNRSAVAERAWRVLRTGLPF
jgi:AcrR family transcriptional regulator